jgi:replicative superfamily II helicase
MLWADEFKQIVSEVAVPGAKDFQATYSWKPGDREGNFIDYNFDIDAYSMQYQGPRAKLDQLNSLVQGVYLPMAQMVQQQGGMIDLHQLTKQYSDLLNLPELMQIVKFGYELEGDTSQQAMTEVPMKSPTSTRNYVRTNVSAASMQDPMQQIAQQMGQQGMQDLGPQTPGGMT